MHRDWPDATDVLGLASHDKDDGLVRFTLSFEGRLPPCSVRDKRVPEKQAFRREFNHQLRQVWATEPHLSSLLKHYDEFEATRLDMGRHRLYRPSNPKK